MTLQETYKKEIIPRLMEKFHYKNVMEAPKLIKIVLNVGFGRHVKEKAYIAAVVKGLSDISGQKPILTKARQSISAFKIREGMTIGCSVTLRGKKMYDFVEKLVNVTFPRVRDFRGINEGHVDRNGNITIGFKECVCFPEMKEDQIDNIFGLEVCIPTTAKTKEEGIELLKLIGFPFKKAD